MEYFTRNMPQLQPDQSRVEVTVRTFETGDAPAFAKLNEAWITRYFRLEEKDAATLNNTYELAKMAVAEPYQGCGIGRALMDAAITWTRQRGARRLWLETNSALTPAIRLYESAGFRHLPPEQRVASLYQRSDVQMELCL